MGKTHYQAGLDVGRIRQIGFAGSVISSRSISKVEIAPNGAASTRQRIREPSSGR
jgi:hypothetical protein